MNIVYVFCCVVLSCCLLPPACSELWDVCCNDTAEDDGICLTFVQVYYTATLIPETLTIERTASLLSVLGLWHIYTAVKDILKREKWPASWYSFKCVSQIASLAAFARAVLNAITKISGTIKIILLLIIDLSVSVMKTESLSVRENNISAVMWING